MKTAISIPDLIYAAAEELAHRRGMSRSALYTEAVARFVRQARSADVTARLDEVYGCEDSTLPADLRALELASLPREEW